jgi:hypothetical protein
VTFRPKRTNQRRELSTYARQREGCSHDENAVKIADMLKGNEVERSSEDILFWVGFRAFVGCRASREQMKVNYRGHLV